jgi:hypothetical protein
MPTMDCRMTGPGWARCVVRWDGTAIVVTASCLWDALGDLLRAVASIADGAGTARAAFCDEPGESRWVFVRQGHGHDAEVRTRILGFARERSTLPDERGREILIMQGPLLELVLAARAMARAALEDGGEAGYPAAGTNHPFPMRECRRLNDILAPHHHD